METLYLLLFRIDADMVPPAGIIITVSVLVAASLALYKENPQVRAWVDRTRHKIAMGLHSLGDEVHPNIRPHRRSMDASMTEEKGEMAEARRQRAVTEIMERSRQMEERRKRRRVDTDGTPHSPSFDTLVDEDGNLREKAQKEIAPEAATSAVETADQQGNLRLRNGTLEPGQRADKPESPTQQLVDPSFSLEELVETPTSDDGVGHLFESRYEQEMREAWNIPLADRRIEIPSSHASDSLMELTPTTDVPDPDFSIPSADHLSRPLERSDYFSAAASNSTHTLSDHGSIPMLSNQQSNDNLVDLSPRPLDHVSVSQAASMSGSVSDIHTSEADDNSDDVLSEIGDGIRTPGSVWTEVDSTVSGDL